MHTGRKNNYLKVDMVFNKDGTLNISMSKYLDNVIRDLPEVISG
jgi:hypothetical protein